MARDVDGLQRPVEVTDTFKTGQRVYVSVEFMGVREGAVLGVRWVRGGKEISVFETPPQKSFSRGFFAFYFDPGEFAGEYVAEILVNGEVTGKVEFLVAGVVG